MHRLLRLVSETHRDVASFSTPSRKRKKRNSKRNKLSDYYGEGATSGGRNVAQGDEDDSADDPFLPFVSTILVNLSSATADEDTCDLAVYMWHDFVYMLKPGTLLRCLYPMVVSIFQVLRKNESEQRSGGFLGADLKKADSVQRMAVNTLRYVIVERRDALQGELCTLPLHAKEMEVVSALAPEVVQVIEESISAISRDDLIRKLISCVIDGQVCLQHFSFLL